MVDDILHGGGGAPSEHSREKKGRRLPMEPKYAEMGSLTQHRVQVLTFAFSLPRILSFPCWTSRARVVLTSLLACISRIARLSFFIFNLLLPTM